MPPRDPFDPLLSQAVWRTPTCTMIAKDCNVDDRDIGHNLRCSDTQPQVIYSEGVWMIAINVHQSSTRVQKTIKSVMFGLFTPSLLFIMLSSPFVCFFSLLVTFPCPVSFSQCLLLAFLSALNVLFPSLPFSISILWRFSRFVSTDFLSVWLRNLNMALLCFYGVFLTGLF